MSDRPNYGHLLVDDESGLKYLTECGTGRRLYKMPPCRICGIASYSYTNTLKDECGSCRPERVEANDTEAA